MGNTRASICSGVVLAFSRPHYIVANMLIQRLDNSICYMYILTLIFLKTHQINSFIAPERDVVSETQTDTSRVIQA